MRVKGMGIIKRGIAVGLIALMACVNPLQTLSPANGTSTGNTDALTGLPTKASAAEKSDPYVGEVRLAVDKDAAKAKQILEDAGYEVIDQDLNEKTGSFWNDLGDQAVFMGIKRTADEKKAIRDMKTMNMLGKYSYSNLEARMENNRKEAKALLEKIRGALGEYKKNYKKKDLAAMKSYRLLNTFREDDSGKLMGEYFLEDIDDESMVKVLLESNEYAKLALMKDLAYAVESPNENGDLWTDRISKVSSYNALIKEYAKKKYGKTGVFGEEKEEIEKQISGDLAEAAEALLKNWADIRKEMAEGDESEVNIEDLEEDDISEENNIQVLNDLKNVSVGDFAKSIKYGKKSLYDLFMVNADTFEKDITKLYPLAYALSEGQRGILDLINPVDLVSAGLIRKSADENKDKVEKEADTMTDSLLEDEEVCSIYEGVDRDMYKDGAAMTSQATQKMQNNDIDYSEKYMQSAKNCLIGTILFTGMTAMAYFLSGLTIVEESNRGINGLANDIIASEVKGDRLIVNETGANTGIITDLWKLTAFIALVFAGVSVYNYIMSQKEQYNRTQMPIPDILVDYDTENEAGKYVTYHAVKWNRDREDKSRADRGDLNGDAAREWLVLYTTTDKTMGTPILADGIVANVGNDDMPSATGDKTYVPLTMFGQTSVQNLVDEKYSFNNKVGGIYLWYQKQANGASATDELIDDREDEPTEEAEAAAGSDENDQQDAEAADADVASGEAAETTGSNIAGGSIVIFITLGAVGGFIIGMICMYFIRRKKWRYSG